MEDDDDQARPPANQDQAPNFPCQICNMSYGTQNGLSQHIRHCHPEDYKQLLLCHICQREFRDPSTLKRHLERGHTKSTPHKCPNCKASIQYEEALNRHLKTHGRSKMEDDDDQARPPADQDQAPNFPCQICNMSYRTQNGLSRHFRHCHPEDYKQQITCHICQHVCRRPSDLRRHLELGHKKSRPLKCPKCRKTYKYEDSLIEHLKGHQEKRKNYSCFKCGMEYVTNQELMDHLQREHDSLNNESKTENDASEDISNPCDNEENTQGEATGGIVEAAPENIIRELDDTVSDTLGTICQSTTEAESGSDTTGTRVLVTFWKCDCDSHNRFFSEDDLEKHLNEHHKLDSSNMKRAA